MQAELDENIDKLVNLLLLIKHNRVTHNDEFSNENLENFNMNLFKVEEKRYIPAGIDDLIGNMVKSFEPLIDEYTNE
jgi:hypothetical protein